MLSHEGLSINWNSENFLAYHDILVRHAFGSMREILSEISYSGMMARYLTYQDSGSRAVSGTSPDENYARELMQLFSVGLIELDEDGSKQLDAHGNPIETYSTENIQEFARCWTGFSLQSMRVNIQNEGHAYGNRIDPMRITGNGADTKRDLFPKMDLHRGHLGDGLPLCADLPPRHFLSAGARYTYLGRTASAKQQPEAIHATTKSRINALGASWTDQVPRLRPPARSQSSKRSRHRFATICTDAPRRARRIRNLRASQRSSPWRTRSTRQGCANRSHGRAFTRGSRHATIRIRPRAMLCSPASVLRHIGTAYVARRR